MNLWGLLLSRIGGGLLAVQWVRDQLQEHGKDDGGRGTGDSKVAASFIRLTGSFTVEFLLPSH